MAVKSEVHQTAPLILIDMGDFEKLSFSGSEVRTAVSDFREETEEHCSLTPGLSWILSSVGHFSNVET